MSFEAASAVERNRLLREDVRRELRGLRFALRRGVIGKGIYFRDAAECVRALMNLRSEAEAGLVDRPRLTKKSGPSGVV